MTDVSDVEIKQLTSMVRTHHQKIHEIEKALDQAPSPETLRKIEHVIKELPSTDELKDCVKDRSERSAMYKKISWGILATVFGTVALATMSLIWQGIGRAIAEVAK